MGEGARSTDNVLINIPSYGERTRHGQTYFGDECMASQMLSREELQLPEACDSVLRTKNSGKKWGPSKEDGEESLWT